MLNWSQRTGLNKPQNSPLEGRMAILRSLCSRFYRGLPSPKNENRNQPAGCLAINQPLWAPRISHLAQGVAVGIIDLLSCAGFQRRRGLSKSGPPCWMVLPGNQKHNNDLEGSGGCDFLRRHIDSEPISFGLEPSVSLASFARLWLPLPNKTKKASLLICRLRASQNKNLCHLPVRKRRLSPHTFHTCRKTWLILKGNPSQQKEKKEATLESR